MAITVSGTSITFNDATVQTTAFTGGGGVTSLNGQTGAITNTSFNAIGSYTGAVAGSGNSVYSAGSTVAGTSLYQQTNVGAGYGPFTGFNNTSGSRYAGQTGTWRAMGDSRNGPASPKAPSNYGAFCNLWVRIS